MEGNSWAHPKGNIASKPYIVFNISGQANFRGFALLFFLKQLFIFSFLLKCLFTFSRKMEEYTLAKDIFGERIPSQSICGEGFSAHAIKSSLPIFCSDLGRGKGKQKVYIGEEILIASSKKGSTRGCGRQIKKEFVLRDLKKENGDDEGVEEDEGKKKWVPTNVESLTSIIERWMRIS
jgi:hypothetical protein